MPLRFLRAHAFIFAVVVLLLSGAMACAEDVRVTVIAILASEKHKDVNERIKEIAAEIHKKEPKLTGFKLERISCQSIAPGDCATLKLVDKETVEVSVNAKTDADGRVTLTIKPPDIGEITYACRCGTFLPIMTDYYTAGPKKERLIIAIMAKPCTKGKKDPPKK